MLLMTAVKRWGWGMYIEDWYLDISDIRSYLKKARIILNESDVVEVSGDFRCLSGFVETLGGKGEKVVLKRFDVSREGN
jgi:hypothetical protein